jgi:hypothetical protein
VSQISQVAHGVLGPSEEAVVAASARTPSVGLQMDKAETNRLAAWKKTPEGPREHQEGERCDLGAQLWCPWSRRCRLGGRAVAEP